MSDENELLFDELYEKTKDCGRVQFIKLLMQKERENQELKKQLEYLRSGEYYNQLRFENEMLQQVVDTNGVPSEVYDYIDCTHRNTELLEENQELKKQLEDTNEELELVRCDLHNRTSERDGYYRNIEMLENQQKEFIEYLENEKDRLARECSQIYEDSLGRTKLVNEDIFNEVDTILSKYRSIIGCDKSE